MRPPFGRPSHASVSPTDRSISSLWDLRTAKLASPFFPSTRSEARIRFLNSAAINRKPSGRKPYRAQFRPLGLSLRIRCSWLSKKSLRACQYRSCCSARSGTEPSLICRCARPTSLDQSFGSQTMLKRGAGGDVPMRQSSNWRPKNRNRSSVISLSQSSAARCSSMNCAAIQMMVTASKPAAYVRSCPRCLWSVRSSWFSINTQLSDSGSLQRISARNKPTLRSGCSSSSSIPKVSARIARLSERASHGV